MKAATQATAIAIVSYSDIEDDDATLGPLFTNLTSRTKTWIVSAAGFYRLMKQNRAFLDGMAGLRYWSVDSSLKFGAGILPARESSNREEWVDPIIGLKGLLPLGRVHVFSSGRLGFGGLRCGIGFHVGRYAQPGISMDPNLLYNRRIRYLDVDYDEDDFLYDAYQDGLVLGLSWRF